ncbi:hypothetical protein BH09MYX1_BH09MYX1_47230 [soil metagenome]
MRKWSLLVLLVGCSRRCGPPWSADASSVQPEASIDAGSEDARLDASPDGTVDAAVDEDDDPPDVCRTTEMDVQRRLRTYCRKVFGCDDDVIDAGQIDRWQAKTFDLDGDGIAEIVETFQLHHEDSEAHLYRGGNLPCVMHLATLASAPNKRLPTRHEGWFDFEIMESELCEGAFACGCVPTLSVFQLTKGAYEEDKTRSREGKAGNCASELDR